MRVYTAEAYTGGSIGNSFMHRQGVQIVCTDSVTGKRKYFPGSNSPCEKLGWFAEHYRSGMNKYDSGQFHVLMQKAQYRAAKYNLDVDMTGEVI